MKKVVALAILILSISCASTKQVYQDNKNLWNISSLSKEEMKMANDILTYGLEHEALYTLLDTLKPISSLGFALSYEIAKDSTMKDGDKAIVDLSSDSTQLAFQELIRWNNVTKALSNDEFTFLLIPYKQPWKGKRNLQLLVVRNSVFSKKISQKAAFFGQWGFTANADPNTVLTTIEYESRNDRYRAYGYLFGYPEHAVDFFVTASISQEETGEFVKRNFFSMPVEAGNSGYFTYAIPQDYTPTRIDSVIYNKAKDRLSNFIELKPKYQKSNGGLDAIRLVQESNQNPSLNQ